MTSKLGPVAKAGDELFIINLQDGQSIKSSGLKAGDVKLVTLQPNPKAFKLADRFPGKAVTASFQALNGSLHISWARRTQGQFPLPAAGTPPGEHKAHPDEKHRGHAV